MAYTVVMNLLLLALLCSANGRAWDGPVPADGAMAQLASLETGHAHYSLGRHENDPDNLVSRAGLLRRAGAVGHLVNALPPAALLGAGRVWGETLAGEHGRDRRLGAVVATILLPVALLCVAGLALWTMADNLFDAVDDAFKPASAARSPETR